MARRFSNRPVIRGARRTSTWIGAGLSEVTLATDDTLLATLNAAALALRPFTIVRSRIAISYLSDQTAANEFSQAVFSAQIVSESAAAAGVDSCASPIDETDADFFIYKPLFFDIISLTSVGVQDTVGDGNFNMIDSKAMRKVGEDQQVVFIIGQRSARGALLAMEGRMLIKLH